MDCQLPANNVNVVTPLQQLWIYVLFHDCWFAEHCRISNVRTKRFLELPSSLLGCTSFGRMSQIST